VPITHTLEVDGATVTFDVREADGSAPVLLMIGSPMGAGGFVTLAGHFSDRTVVAYDPRGIERSTKADPTSESTPEQHAVDLHKIIEALGSGPVDLFASSGGAVNALALVAAHPGAVRTLVAHEPPLASILPDREGALAASRAVHDAYERNGFGAGMARFIGVVSHRGLFDSSYAGQPAPEPAMFGLPAEDDGNRSDPLLGQNIVSATHFEPDFDALRAAPTHIVLAAGVESEGQLAYRGAIAAAGRLGQQPVFFPSDHGGFLGGEYGQSGDPDAFAAKLREVLGDA
jgi:pimeloyl-ACP methyl ester carboxylesterase